MLILQSIDHMDVIAEPIGTYLRRLVQNSTYRMNASANIINPKAYVVSEAPLHQRLQQTRQVRRKLDSASASYGLA